MDAMKKILTCLCAGLLLFACTQKEVAAATTASSDSLLKRIKMPPGFKISLYANKIKNARSMVRGPQGTLFVGTQEGKVYGLVDTNNDNVIDKVYTLAEGLNMPNGVAFADAIARILRCFSLEIICISNRIDQLTQQLVDACFLRALSRPNDRRQ